MTEEYSTAKFHFWVCCGDEKVFVREPKKTAMTRRTKQWFVGLLVCYDRHHFYKQRIARAHWIGVFLIRPRREEKSSNWQFLEQNCTHNKDYPFFSLIYCRSISLAGLPNQPESSPFTLLLTGQAYCVCVFSDCVTTVFCNSQQKEGITECENGIQ